MALIVATDCDRQRRADSGHIQNKHAPLAARYHGTSPQVAGSGSPARNAIAS